MKKIIILSAVLCTSFGFSESRVEDQEEQHEQHACTSCGQEEDGKKSDDLTTAEAELLLSCSCCGKDKNKR